MLLNFKNIRILALVFLLQAFLNSCSKGSGGLKPENPTPAISSISVSYGRYSTPLVIKGSGFIPAPTSNQVFFNGQAAVINSASTTELDVIVPKAAGTGNITVKVNGQTIQGPVFTYVPTAIVKTLAGGGPAGHADGLGTSASFSSPEGVGVDNSGNVYVADQLNNLIRKIDTNGMVSTIAGNLAAGSKDGIGTNATFSEPTGIWVDSGGNIFVADAGNNKIRKITSNGTVTTVAGSGVKGSADGPGSTASFNGPCSLVGDNNGNIYISDLGNNKIRKISSDGAVSTVAGTGFAALTNGPAATATFNFPRNIALDSSNNLYIADNKDYALRLLTPNGIVSSISPVINPNDNTGFMPYGIAIDRAGYLYVSNSTYYTIDILIPNLPLITLAGTGSAALGDQVHTPDGIVMTTNGTLFVADTGSEAIRKITFE